MESFSETGEIESGDRELFYRLSERWDGIVRDNAEGIIYEGPRGEIRLEVDDDKKIEVLGVPPENSGYPDAKLVRDVRSIEGATACVPFGFISENEWHGRYVGFGSPVTVYPSPDATVEEYNYTGPAGPDWASRVRDRTPSSERRSTPRDP